ncbi:MAG: hypothetical protein AAGC77_04865 [Pseudomonadota bacterium]
MRALATALLLLFVAPAPAAAQHVYVSSGVEYLVGDYGAPEKSKTLYAPFSVDFLAEGWVLSATIPVVRVSGETFFIGENIPAPIIDRLLDRPEVRDLMEPRSGFGDISATIRKEFALSEDWYVSAICTVSAPTGDDTRGLGAGAWSGAYETELLREFDEAYIYGVFGRRFSQDVQSLPLSDTWRASIGGAQHLGRDFWLSANYDWREPLLEQSTSLSEAMIALSAPLNQSLQVQVYVVAGFTESSPDYGLGVQFSLAAF